MYTTENQSVLFSRCCSLPGNNHSLQFGDTFPSFLLFLSMNIHALIHSTNICGRPLLSQVSSQVTQTQQERGFYYKMYTRQALCGGHVFTHSPIVSACPLTHPEAVCVRCLCISTVHSRLSSKTLASPHGSTEICLIGSLMLTATSVPPP